MIHPLNPDQLENAPWRYWPAAISALIAICLYAPTLWGTFIYDDLAQVVRDPRLKDIKLWGEYFTEAYFPSGPDRLWRPLVSLSYAVQYQLHGPIAWPFHLVNVLLHAAASAMVAMLAIRIARLRSSGAEIHQDQDADRTALRIGLIAGVLFAVHPAHVEGVAYIVGRADLLCTIGVLSALLLAISNWTRARAIGIFICTWLAIFSKEQGLMTPLMLAGIWIWKKRLNRDNTTEDIARFENEKTVARGMAAALTLTLAAYSFYRQRMFSWTWNASSLDEFIQPLAQSTTGERLISAVAILGRAIQLMIAPVRLSPEYGYAVITPKPAWNDPYLWTGAIALFTLIALFAISIRRRAWGMIFLLGCAGVTYGVVSNITLIGTPFGERLVYLPSAFLLILIAIWLGICARQRRFINAALLLVVALFCWRTVTYAVRWNDRLTFLETSLAENPRAVRLAVLVAEEKIHVGDWPGARRAVEHGLKVAPDYWKLWSQGMWISIEERKFTEAGVWREGAWNRGGYPPDMLFLSGLLEKRAIQYGMETANAYLWPGTKMRRP